MDFYESITNALYCRMEEGALSVPLEESEPYTEGLAALRDALAVVQDKEARERAVNAARRLCDVYTHFFYRVGLQDGVKLTAADFLTRGIEWA